MAGVLPALATSAWRQLSSRLQKFGVALLIFSSGSLWSTHAAAQVTDNFNRSNGGLGTNWTTTVDIDGPLQIVGNQVQPAAGMLGESIYNAFTFGAAQFSEVQMASGLAGGVINLNLRARQYTTAGTADMYRGQLLGLDNIWRILRLDNNVETVLASGAMTYSNGDTYYFEADGSTLTLKKNGVTFGSVTDSTYTSGQAGLGIYNHVALLVDNWRGGDLSGVSAGTLQLSSATYSAGEGGGSVTVTVTRTGGTTGAVGLNYATSNGSAVSGSDYTAASGTLNWSAGDNANKIFTVSILEDSLIEGGEVFNINLSAVTGGAVLGSPAAATMTITDNDVAAAGALQFSLSSYAAGEGGATASITVTRTGGSSGAVGISYSTSNGTATAGSDYSASSGTLSWGNGDTTSKSFVVGLLEDIAVEGTETVNLTLSSPSGGTTLGSPSSATLSISDNDSTGSAPSSLIVETHIIYDSRGNVVQKSNPYYVSGTPVYTTTAYDSLNRPYQTQRPTSDTNSALVTETVTYSGLTVTKTDGLSHTTVVVSSAWGAVSRATDQAGNHTGYTYTSFGDLKTATDPAGNVSTIGYNIRGFKTSSSDPDMGSWSFTYDALGQMLVQTDAKGQTTTFAYDALGRMATRIDHGGGSANTTTWYWDTATKGVGQLASVTSPGGYQEAYLYDSLGRRQKTTTTTIEGSYEMEFGYDSASGRPRTVIYPASTGTRLSVEYAYHNGFVRDVRDVASNSVIWQANSQDSQGHVTEQLYGNGQRTNLAFDQTTGRLRTVQTATGGGTSIQNLLYGWDAVGNLETRQDVNQSLTELFGYDLTYRLETVHRNGTPTLTMGYNSIGNISSKSDIGSYTYPVSGGGSIRPHAVTTAAGSSYAYDANGNMTSRSGATVTWSTYNYPLTITQSGGNTSAFSYGPERQRYRQVSVDAGVTEDRVTVGGGAFEKLVRGGTIEYRHFVQVGGKAVAIVKRSNQSGNDTFYLHEDHLGSTDVITSQSGSMAVRLSFDAWGQRRGTAWTGTLSAPDKVAITASTHRGYTGHEQLDNLNLVHMNGRVYDPALARFISADPVIQDPFHSQSFNRYSYTWNNPLNATDPTGFESDNCIGKTGSLICRPGTADNIQAIKEMLGDVKDNGVRKSEAKSTSVQTNVDNNSKQTHIDANAPRERAERIRAGRAREASSGDDAFGMDDAASIGVGLYPPTGLASDAYTAYEGKDYFTKDKVSGFWRFAGIVPWVSELRKFGKVFSAARGGTEVVQRAMSRAELQAMRDTGLVRGGRGGTHHVSDAVNSDALRARQRLALDQTPEVRVTMEVPQGSFSPPSRINPASNMPGGGMERTATGPIPANILRVDGY